MKLKTVSTSLLIISAVTLLAVLAFHVRVGVTADSVVVLKTTGMTCGSCAGKITKALESLKGVAATDVDVEKGWVIVGYDTKSVEPETLARTVKTTGFDCNVHKVLTPEQFKQITGRAIGQDSGGRCGGCCGHIQS